MSAADEAQTAFSAGNAAFVDDDYSKAAELYTTAISHNDTEPEFYIKRAQAYLKLGQHAEAILDTKSALQFAPESHRAHFRQGQAYFASGSLPEAVQSLTLAKQYGETHPECDTLLKNCHAALGTTTAEGAPAAGIGSSSTLVSSDAPPVKPELRIQHDWYQVAAFVTVDVFIKKADPSAVSVEFTPTTLSVTVKLPSGADYSLELDLCYKIVPDKSKYSVKGTKIEIRMAKKAHVHWPSLEGQGLEGGEGPAVSMASASAADAVTAKPPGYETEQKWNKLGAQIEEEEKNEKVEGDAALNKLFQDIYKNGTPEQMRAMNKSFQESGGTVLSTNWDEVGSKKTDVKPPDGMEFKKWE